MTKQMELGLSGQLARRLVKAIGVVAVTSMVLSGCGGGSNESQDKNKEVKIGIPGPLTGAWGESGLNSLNGALLAIEDINAAGGIKALDGAKMRGIKADTSSSDPGQSASVTRRLIQQDKVSALIGSYASALSLTSSTEAEKAKVPILTQSYSDELTSRGYKFLFQLPPTSSALGDSVLPYMRDAYAAEKINLQRVGIIASNDAAIQAQAKQSAKVAKDLGLDVVSTQYFPIDLTDASVLAQKIVRAKPDVILLGGPTEAINLVVGTLKNLDYRGPMVGLGGGGMLAKGFGQALGQNVEGILSMSAWNPDMAYPGLEDVNKRYMEKFNEPFMPQEAGESYVAAWVIKEAIEEAKSDKSTDIAAALRTIKIDSSPASFMPGGKVSFDVKGLSPAFPILVQWQDGVPKTVWPENVQVVKPLS